MNVLKLIIRLNSMELENNQDLFMQLELDRALFYLFKTKQDVVKVKTKDGKMSLKNIDHNKNIQAITMIQ